MRNPVAGYLDYEPLATENIRELTGDQPYLIHLLCRTIVDYCNERRKTYATINDVNTVLHEVMQTLRQFISTGSGIRFIPEERVINILATLILAQKKEAGSFFFFFFFFFFVTASRTRAITF